MKAFKLNGQRWYQPSWCGWYLAPVFAELMHRTGPEASREGAHHFARGARGGELLFLSRTFPWPLPESSECGSYWDQLRTWQRVRDEVICPGCGECTPFVLDREPMGSGLLPSAITFDVECRGCGGKSRCGFSWHSWALFFVRFDPLKLGGV